MGKEEYRDISCYTFLNFKTPKPLNSALWGFDYTSIAYAFVSAVR